MEMPEDRHSDCNSMNCPKGGQSVTAWVPPVAQTACVCGTKQIKEGIDNTETDRAESRKQSWKAREQKEEQQTEQGKGIRMVPGERAELIWWHACQNMSPLSFAVVISSMLLFTCCLFMLWVFTRLHLSQNIFLWKGPDLSTRKQGQLEKSPQAF